MRETHTIQLGPHRLAIADLCAFVDGAWLVCRINVPSGYRGQGYGTELLRRVCEEADAEEVVLVLEVNAYGDLNDDQLREWYSRYGFEEVEDPEDTFYEYMRRMPE